MTHLPRAIIRHDEDGRERKHTNIGIVSGLEWQKPTMVQRGGSCWRWCCAIQTRRSSYRKPPRGNRIDHCRRGDFHCNGVSCKWDGVNGQRSTGWRSTKDIPLGGKYRPICCIQSRWSGIVGLPSERCHWRNFRRRYRKAFWTRIKGLSKELLTSTYCMAPIAAVLDVKQICQLRAGSPVSPTCQRRHWIQQRRLKREANRCQAVSLLGVRNYSVRSRINAAGKVVTASQEVGTYIDSRLLQNCQRESITCSRKQS